MDSIKGRLLPLLNDLFELPSNTLTGSELLYDSELYWSSIEVIGFIAICDEQFNVIVSASELKNANTVSDLINLVESKAAASIA
jgi:acyl carrier protein